MNRSEIVHQQFIQRVRAGELPACATALGDMSRAQLADLVESQLMSRLLDIVSRRLSARRQSFYTIGSAGHEGNAAVAAALRVNDPAFLHYRSGAFALQRSKQLPGSTPLYDMLLAFTAGREDPIAGGRHKVIGSRPLWIPPQTSTIASHLPKAVGAAHALGLYPKVPHEDVGLSDDSIVLCSFGDASLNHSTAQGALNTACWAAYQWAPMPILFVCEDNGIGISTPTPKGWVAASVQGRPGLRYFHADGRDAVATYHQARAAADYVRRQRKPAFLHLSTVRLMAHAGSDMENTYHSAAEIAAAEAQDPLLYSAAALLQHGVMDAASLVALYQRLEARITRIAADAVARPKLADAADVMASIHAPACNVPKLVGEHSLPGGDSHFARHRDKPLPLVRQLNLALNDILERHPQALVFGEDVAKKGGVYGVTQGLWQRFGGQRVINTLLDEQSILGLAIGLAQCGYLPIAEIQYLAYLHNAEDQLRGEAATLAFFSQGQFTNPMVIRIAGFAYQRGFGGHFHNDNAFAVLRDIPGIVVMSPSSGAEAVHMLRLAVDLALREQKVVVIIEPIALYSTTDLLQPDDQAWAAPYPASELPPPFQDGEVGEHGSGTLCLVSYANGYYLSRQAAARLEQDYGLRCKVVDLRWLQPLPLASFWRSVKDCRAVLVVDECRRSGSPSEALLAHLLEQGYGGAVARVCAEDSFIPLGDAAYHVLPSVEGIVEAACRLCPAPAVRVAGAGQ